MASPVEEIEAAARVLHKAGIHHWWKPYNKSYDECVTDAIAKEEFNALVEQMLIVAREARPSN